MHAHKNVWKKWQEQAEADADADAKRNKSQKAIDYEVIDAGLNNFFYAN